HTEDARRQRLALYRARGQAAAAHLVLQPLEAEPRMRSLRHEAGEAAGRIREREEELEDGMRAEPLVPGDLVPAVAGGLCTSAVRAQVRATLLLRHDHAGLRVAVV